VHFLSIRLIVGEKMHNHGAVIAQDMLVLGNNGKIFLIHHSRAYPTVEI